MQRPSRLWSAIAAGTLIYRAFWAFSIKTTFVPDEYYQTVEPINIIFYGGSNNGLSSTWEWRDEFRIRSFVPLIPYMLLYQMKFFLGSSLSAFMHEVVVLKFPRLVNAIISSYSDFLLCAILKKITRSDSPAIFITCIHLFSWSGSYCLSRTLANSTETAFLIIGLYFWLSESSCKEENNQSIEVGVSSSSNCEQKNINSKRISGEDKGDLRLRKQIPSSKIVEDPGIKRDSVTVSNDYYMSSLALALIALTVHCRPTAVLFWAPLVILRITQQTSPWRYVVFHCLPTGLAVLLLCVLIDSIFYARFTVTPFNFFYINITRNYAALFYGAKSWHWNFSHGLPVMLGLYTPVLVLSILVTPQPDDAIILIVVSLLNAVLLRCVTAHQEYRFLLPALPFLHISVGFTLWDLAVWCLPGLGEPSRHSRHSHTVLSYCLSSLGLWSHVKSKVGVDKTSSGSEENNEGRRNSRSNGGMDSLALGGGSIKQDQDRCATGVRGERRNEEEVKRKDSPSVARMLCLSSLVLVVTTHLSAAYYLSTRHQVRLYRISYYSTSVGNRIDREDNKISNC
jgi:Alg9-like mannosyltransferase family